MFSACDIHKRGHSDLVSGLEGDFAQRCLTAKLEVSSSNGNKTCLSNGRTDGLMAGRTDDGQRVIAIAQLTYSQLS